MPRNQSLNRNVCACLTFLRTQVRCTHVSRFVCHKRNDRNLCTFAWAITEKKTSSLAPSLTHQKKGVQPDCLKLRELPSQRVGQGEPFPRSPLSPTLPDSCGYLENRGLGRPSSKEAFGGFVAEKSSDHVSTISLPPWRPGNRCVIQVVMLDSVAIWVQANPGITRQCS